MDEKAFWNVYSREKTSTINKAEIQIVNGEKLQKTQNGEEEKDHRWDINNVIPVFISLFNYTLFMYDNMYTSYTYANTDDKRCIENTSVQ